MLKTSLKLTILVFLLLLNSCAVLMVGGAAAGGYYIATDERTVKEMGSDARITADINYYIARDNEVNVFDIDVDTKEGHVTLYGIVPEQEIIDRCVEIAESVKGVKSVTSKLKILKL